MTLSTFLSGHVEAPSSPDQIPAPNLDPTRSGWNSHGGGGWRGGKGNTNAALSALTLLAFLFFLNVLQSCLKDSVNQTPGVVVMMMPTPAAEAARNRREVEGARGKWDDTRISEIVHNNVESYWATKGADKRNLKQNKKYKPTITNAKGLRNKFQNRISTKLDVFTTKTKNDTSQHFENNKSLNATPKTSIVDNAMTKKDPANKSNWINMVKKTIVMSQPIISKMLCCDVIVCTSLRSEQDNLLAPTNTAIRKILLWFCNGQNQEPCAQDLTRLRNCMNPFVRKLLQS